MNDSGSADDSMVCDRRLVSDEDKSMLVGSLTILLLPNGLPRMSRRKFVIRSDELSTELFPFDTLLALPQLDKDAFRKEASVETVGRSMNY